MEILKVLTRSLTICALVISIAKPAIAQSTAGTSDGKANAFSGPRKQLATIIFAGLGGAVLGLSTLSFYGRPQDNLRNIAIGGAVGVIAGTVFVTYKAATDPRELYGTLTESERTLATNRTPMPSGNEKGPAPLGLNLAFDF